MLISEIFYSIQGEGELTGVPSVFIRTSGCNLRCRWCDTPYASWTPEGVEMGVEQIVEEVKRFPAANHCVLTGGEPMVARNIRKLAAALRAEGLHITIETAGTVAPEGIACDLASLSPKLTNSTPTQDSIDPAWIARHELARMQSDILRAWIESTHVQMKFVVSGIGDVAEIEATIASIDRAIPPSRILLMPEGTDSTTLKARQSDVLAICLKRGYRYCDRLHIHLFGNTKGT